MKYIKVEHKYILQQNYRGNYSLKEDRTEPKSGRKRTMNPDWLGLTRGECLWLMYVFAGACIGAKFSGWRCSDVS